MSIFSVILCCVGYNLCVLYVPYNIVVYGTDQACCCCNPANIFFSNICSGMMNQQKVKIAGSTWFAIGHWANKMPL